MADSDRIQELQTRLNDRRTAMTGAEKALHEFYERVSYLISDKATFSPADPDRIVFVAMAVHDYERATGRPLTDTGYPVPVQVN
jgi:hypothetical protein